MSEIQFVTQPSVYVTAKLLPQFDEIDRFLNEHEFGGESLLRDPQSVEVPITIGSRSCYQSWDAGREHSAHVRHLVEVQHGSCLEHCVWQVVLSGISRACGRELLRHRHLSPSELSQRYCDMRYARFVIPPRLLADYEVARRPLTGRESSKDHEFWKSRYRFRLFSSQCEDAVWKYTQLLPEKPTKKDRETARAVLPECVETRIVFTGNSRAFRNLFERRCSDAADAEIRRVCCLLFERLEASAPSVFADYEKLDLHDGTFELKTPTRAV